MTVKKLSRLAFLSVWSVLFALIMFGASTLPTPALADGTGGDTLPVENDTLPNGRCSVNPDSIESDQVSFIDAVHILTNMLLTDNTGWVQILLLNIL